MILFDNKTKIIWDHDNHLESKVKKIKNSISNKSNVEIWKKIKLKKRFDSARVNLSILEPSYTTEITSYKKNSIKLWISMLK